MAKYSQHPGIARGGGLPLAMIFLCPYSPERGGEERGGEDEEVGTDEEEEEAEPPGQHTRFGPRWANFVRNLIE